jgi:hypothetical protein
VGGDGRSAAVGLAGSRAALGDRRSGAGPGDLAARRRGANELSGITWADGDRWAAVSDGDGRLYWLRIAINPADGRITSATVDGAVPLPKSTDLEGVALLPGGSSVVVTDEVGPVIREYSLADGQLLRARRSRRCARHSATTSASKR